MELNKIYITRKVKTKLSDEEVLKKLTAVFKKNIQQNSRFILITGPAFYNSQCYLMGTGELEIKIQLKTPFLIGFPLFIILWTIGTLESEGLVLGAISSLLVTLFFVFVNRGLMIATLAQIEKVLKGYSYL